MDASEARFEALITEAQAAGFEGWDFSYLRGRWRDADPPWDYRAEARVALARAASALDMGTGGGEVLASLAPFPPRMVAIEGWERNAPVAHRRLAPLGVPLVRVESERPLPFPDETFDLCLNRHDGYEPQGLYRVLARGGRFLTQQVGGRNCAELNDLLACPIPFEFGYWTPDFAVAALERAGLRIVRVAEAFPPVDITDIGAVHYYLRIVSWQMKDYDPVTYHDRLLALHRRIERAGPLRIHEHRFLIEARRR